MSECLVNCLGKSAHDALFISATHALGNSMSEAYSSLIESTENPILKTTVNVVTFVAFCPLAVVALAELVVRCVQSLMIFLSYFFLQFCCQREFIDDSLLELYMVQTVKNTSEFVIAPVAIFFQLFCASDS